MVLNSAVVSCNFNQDAEKQKSPQLVVNTVDFNDQDLVDYINISEEIERTTRERRSQRKCFKARSKTMVATMTREEIFESTNIDDDQFLEAMEHETTYDTEKDHAALVNSIENLMKYFDEDVSVRDESLGKTSPIKKYTRGKVASAVASLRNKCGLTLSPVHRRKIRQTEVKPNIRELKKIYETSTEIETSPSPRSIKFKSPKLSRKTKVKQMASLFNNKINSMIKSSSPEPQSPDTVSSGIESITSPSYTSTLKPKSPKVKRKFPTYVTKLPSPKPSPFFKRKQLQKSSSINSLANTPVTKRKQLQQQSNTTCLVAEHVFSQLSVKNKALLYNKFIADMSKKNPKFSKHAEMLESNVKKEMQRGEVVFEKQDTVKNLRDSLEAKLTPTKTFSKTLERFKSSTSKLSLDITPKSKEYEDIFQTDLSTNRWEDDSQEQLHVSTLTLVLKSSPETTKCHGESKSQRKNKDATFLEDVSIVEPSHKRTQSMIRASFCVEPLAPPKKIRRTQHERLAPDTFFQNPQLEKLFYYWLKEKNGVIFDITSVNNKTNIIEIVHKNTRDNVLSRQEVERILEAAIKKLEADEKKQFAKGDNSNDAIDLIKYTIENEEIQNNSVIEVELPLEVEIANPESQDIETEESDLGLASIKKTTSEDSLAECQLLDVSNLSTKLWRKKKLRRKENSSNNIFSTDSDSDSKAKALELQTCTLPKSKKCSNYIKKLIYKTFHSSMPSEQLNNEPLDRSLIRQVNSPSKVKSAYTLTVISSSSPNSGSDFCDTDLPMSPMKEASRSWPSLLEANLNSDTNLLKYKFLSTEFINLTKCKMEQELRKPLVDSFIDQGFETGSNDTESPFKLPRKTNHNINESLEKREKPKSSSTSFKDKSSQAYTTQPDTMTIIKEDSNTEDSEVGNNTPSSLNEGASFFSQNSSKYPLGVTQNGNSSQFWITTGDFTAAITIHHYESERLLLLSNIYAQKSLKTREMNFGIDDQKFCLDSTATPDEIIEKVPKEDNCSQYWFSTGNFVLPFRGKQMTAQKIHGFFNYIRVFMEESGSLKFGIDGYEFSNIYQQTQNSISPFSGHTSPSKTSDLGQSDIYSQQHDQSITFSALSQHLDSSSCNSEDQQLCSLDHVNISKCQTDKQSQKSEGSVPEMLKALQKQQTKLKLLEDRMLNCTNTTTGTQIPVGTNESDKYMKKLKIIVAAIHNIGRNNGFGACTIEQLESFMHLLSRYADLCFANCNAQIENILNVVMHQHLLRT